MAEEDIKKKNTQNNISFGFRHCSPTRVPSIHFCHYLPFTLSPCCLGVKAGLHSGQVASSSQRQPTITLKWVPIGNLQLAFSLMLMALHSRRKAYYQERDPHRHRGHTWNDSKACLTTAPPSHTSNSFFVKNLENKKHVINIVKCSYCLPDWN